jgi:hypothetical protein
VALTGDAEHALGGTREVSLTHFPFNVGRRRRSRRSDVSETASEDGNHLLLSERPEATSLHISGEHFSVEYLDGRFFIVDRESACGVTVAGERVGGNRVGGRAEIRDGDELVVGTPTSPFVFRFEVNSGSVPGMLHC